MKEIEEMGGSFRFRAKATDLIFENSELKAVEINNNEQIPAQVCVLAIGHSARDTFEMLEKCGFSMEPKAFAVGLRIEHPQKMINLDLYGEEENEFLGAAAYKVTHKCANGRGVYSFCMCPGGYVVNASSEEGKLAVNGMSYQARDAENANSAMIVTVTPEDFPGEGPLAGVEFQRILERKAWEIGQGKIPVQLFGDFKADRVSTAFGEVTPCMKGDYIFGNLRCVLPKQVSASIEEGVTAFGRILPGFDREDALEVTPCMKGDYIFGNLRCVLPKQVSASIEEGVTAFGRILPGFDREDALLSGVESRTSSPVRIIRNQELVSNMAGVYPCGEGAGYAGGITSAAMDGLKIAETISKKYRNSLRRGCRICRRHYQRCHGRSEDCGNHF